jgi:hypothetical protein
MVINSSPFPVDSCHEDEKETKSWSPLAVTTVTVPVIAARSATGSTWALSICPWAVQGPRMVPKPATVTVEVLMSPEHCMANLIGTACSRVTLADAAAAACGPLC